MSAYWLKTVLVGTAFFASGSALATAVPDYVKVRSITYAGSGCPAGSVAENVAPDLTAITLLFDSFIAEGGYGAPRPEARKNCQINLDLDFPQGWSLTIANLDYRGYAALDRGVRGVQKTDYYFQGETEQASFETTLAGNYDADYHVRDSLALDAVIWSKCGANKSININTQIRVEGANNRRGGLMTIDSIDGSLVHKYGLQWKRCGDTGGGDGGGRPGGGDDEDDGRPGDIDLPPSVTIKSIAHAGSGCPAGTVAENLAPDATAFTLLFDSFIGEVGPGVSIRERRKNCQVLLDMDYPDGWTYALATLDYRGYVSMDHRVTGLQQASYYFQGGREELTFKTEFAGAADEDYLVRDTLPLDALLWSKCGEKRALNINAEVRLDNSRNRSGAGIMTLDSVDGKIGHTYGLIWRRCR